MNGSLESSPAEGRESEEEEEEEEEERSRKGTTLWTTSRHESCHSSLWLVCRSTFSTEEEGAEQEAQDAAAQRKGDRRRLPAEQRGSSRWPGLPGPRASVQRPPAR